MNQTWLKIPNDEGRVATKEGEAVSNHKTRGRRPSQIKRREILRVAREQFLANGYDGTSIDSIVDIVGGSKSTIYSHFGNKESLFGAVIRDTGHADTTPDFPLMNGIIRDELIAFAESRLKRVLSPLNIGIMRIVIAEAPRFTQIAELFYRNAPEPTYVALESYLTAAVKQQKLAIADVTQAAEFFLGGLIQRQLLAYLFGVENDHPISAIKAKASSSVDLFLAQYTPIKT